MLRRNVVLKLLQGCHLLVSIAKISKNHHNIQKWFNGHLNFSYLIWLNLKPKGSFFFEDAINFLSLIGEPPLSGGPGAIAPPPLLIRLWVEEY